MPKIDLHMHSTTSDGLLSPTELVRAAQALSLTTIALTDHDTTDGIVEAQTTGREFGVEVIAGAEINSEGEYGDIHFLAYYLDPTYAPLQDKLLAIRDARVGRAQGMLKKLAEMGMPVAWERVLEIAGDAASLARPHIARALLEAGHVASTQEAFDKYISNAGPAYVGRYRLTAKETIDLIHAAGGLIVLAHPPRAGTVALIPMLHGLGLDGIEVYYPEHTPEEMARLEHIAAERDLLMTGGSDFHGWDDGVHANLGRLYVPPECADRLRARANQKSGF
ncbi:MAG TPA: PHP domain-containing protein [Anaerolineae bacterium]|nr:PHP domain-containing protein [Anaerolineae bacterium]